MKIKVIIHQHRRDFRAILECENCKHEQKLNTGYDDEHYDGVETQQLKEWGRMVGVTPQSPDETAEEFRQRVLAAKPPEASDPKPLLKEGHFYKVWFEGGEGSVGQWAGEGLRPGFFLPGNEETYSLDEFEKVGAEIRVERGSDHE